MEIDVVRLEDNAEYGIIDTITDNKNNHYLFLVKIDDEQKKCIRKVITKEGKDLLVKLSSNEEYDDVMNLFYKKHEGEINEK